MNEDSGWLLRLFSKLTLIQTQHHSNSREPWRNLGKDELKPVSIQTLRLNESYLRLKSWLQPKPRSLKFLRLVRNKLGDQDAPPMTRSASPTFAPESSSRPFLHISRIPPGWSFPRWVISRLKCGAMLSRHSRSLVQLLELFSKPFPNGALTSGTDKCSLIKLHGTALHFEG